MTTLLVLGAIWVVASILTSPFVGRMLRDREPDTRNYSRGYYAAHDPRRWPVRGEGARLP